MLSSEEIQRYRHHLSLNEIGLHGQTTLKKSRVLCVGAGGLGSPLLQYLTAAGVGTLGVMDDDCVELSNLQRQVIFATDQINQKKVSAAKERLLTMNPNLVVNTYPERLTEKTDYAFFSEYNVIADCTDNLATRVLINAICFQLKKPYVYAGVLGFSGQVSVFHAETGPCYRCLFPENTASPSCSENGVLGVLPGILGAIQATEVIKYLLKIGESLLGRLLMFDAFSMQMKTVTLTKNPLCPLCGDVPMSNAINANVEEISPTDLKKLIDEKADFILLDVRNPDEYAESNLQGVLIPLPELPKKLASLDKEKCYVVHCKSGGRSLQAMHYMKQHGFTKVANLKGGILGCKGVLI